MIADLFHALAGKRGTSVLLCDVFRSEVEHGGERRPARSPADLQLGLDTESEPPESRRRPAGMR